MREIQRPHSFIVHLKLFSSNNQSEKSYKTKEINSFSIFSKEENKHSFVKLTINNGKNTM